MPTLHLQIAPLSSRNAEQCAVLAHRLTAITAETLGKRPEVTAVLIDELPATRWHIGGAPVEQPTARLEICITQGTNTAGQKAAFIDAVWHELQLQLGHSQPLESASYVVVREVPASDWGYGGRTQLARQLQREQQGAAAAAT